MILIPVCARVSIVPHVFAIIPLIFTPKDLIEFLILCPFVLFYRALDTLFMLYASVYHPTKSRNQITSLSDYVKR